MRALEASAAALCEPLLPNHAPQMYASSCPVVSQLNSLPAPGSPVCDAHGVVTFAPGGCPGGWYQWQPGYVGPRSVQCAGPSGQ